LDEVRTNDRWLVVSDDQDIEYVCTLIDVSAELEWRTLVVGNNVTCCRSESIFSISHQFKWKFI
jgi:hypothetical protein